MIVLAAAAVNTSRIRLGTMVIPVPLRQPWKIASESVALDRLSNGRVTLGLGAGAVWMGWQAFPDTVTDPRLRAEMLDETIDILDLLYQRQPFDYDGKHYHLKLTQLDVQFYPPPPVQQPPMGGGRVAAHEIHAAHSQMRWAAAAEDEPRGAV